MEPEKIDLTLKNTQPVKKVTQNQNGAKKMNVLKKLDLDTAKLLSQIKDKANKKAFGRKIKDSEIIAAGIKLITAEQISSLQEQSYTEKDRLKMAHDEYQKNHGKISLDQFIGKLIRGELLQK